MNTPSNPEKDSKIFPEENTSDERQIITPKENIKHTQIDSVQVLIPGAQNTGVADIEVMAPQGTSKSSNTMREPVDVVLPPLQTDENRGLQVTANVSMSDDLTEIDSNNEKKSKRNETLRRDIMPSIDRYRQKKILGQGGMGTVLLVDDQVLQRDVAMKVIKAKGELSENSYRRFIQEARINGVLEHPNIIPIYDLTIADANPYFTMPLVKGTTLSQIIKGRHENNPKYQEYSFVRLLQIMLNVCYAIEFAHSKNIIHRDLKPDNIMIGAFGKVLVMDWGLAKDISVERTETRKNPSWAESLQDISQVDATVDGAIVGTPLYMAPEQAQGKVDFIDKSSDLYTLGVILYELITYRPPFRGKTMYELLDQVVNRPPEFPKYNTQKEPIPKEVIAIALKAMAKNKLERYPSVADFRNDIQNFLEGRPVSAAPDNILGRTIKLIQRNAEISIVATIAFFILLVAYHFFSVKFTEQEVQKNISSLQIENLESATLDTQKWAEAMQVWERKIVDEQLKLQQSYLRRKAIQEQLQNPLEEKEQHKLQENLQQITGVITESENFLEKHYQHLLDINYLTAQNNLAFTRFYILVATHADLQQKCFEYYQRAQQKFISSSQLEESINKDQTIQKMPETQRQDFIASTHKVHQEIQKQLQELQISLLGQGQVSIENRPANISLWRFVFATSQWETCDIPTEPTFSLAVGSYLIKTDALSIPFWVKNQAQVNISLKQPNELEGMVYIAPEDYQLHLRRSQVPYPFFIDQREVSIGQYLQFFKAKGKPEQYIAKMNFAGKAVPLWNEYLQLQFGLTSEDAVFGVSYQAALDFCDWRSEQYGYDFALPSPQEWEKAACGVDGRLFPWGNEHSKSPHTASLLEPLADVQDTGVYGVMTMAGNVSEWVNNTDMPQNQAIIKGKNGGHFPLYLQTKVTSDIVALVGFRCVCRTVSYK